MLSVTCHIFIARSTLCMLATFAGSLITCGQSTRAPSNGLRINEILFAPVDTEHEFIEFYNSSTQEIDLCSLTFSDSRMDPLSICENQVHIPPSSYAVIARNGIALTHVFPQLSSPSNILITPLTWPALNNSGDEVILFEGSEFVDAVTYQPSWGQRGVSIERKDPAGPSSLAFNWAPSTASKGATPGEINSQFAPDRTAPFIRLSEVYSANHVFMAWSEPVAQDALSATQFRIQQQEPKEIAFLTDTTMTLRFETNVSGRTITSRGATDLTGNVSNTLSSPLSYIPKRGDFVINEVLFEPWADAFDLREDQPEFIEVFNTSNRHLSLRPIKLTGREDERADADTMQSHVLYPVLSPGGYAVFYSEIPTISGKPALLAAFPRLEERLADVTLLPIAGSSLRLSNSGDLVRFITSNHEIIDELRYSPSWHHPSLASTRGISLERRAPEIGSPNASNWSSSVALDGGTPGAVNSIRIVESNGGEQTSAPAMELTPSPFSPDGDGIDDVLSIRLRFQHAPQSVRIVLFDSRGRLVRTIVRESLAGSDSRFLWDGLSDSGKKVRSGIYIVFVDILDVDRGTHIVLKDTVVLATRAG